MGLFSRVINANRDMEVSRIFIPKENINKQTKEEKIFNEEVPKVSGNFFIFLKEYISCFQKKCGSSCKDVQLKNVAIRKEISIPFFFNPEE